MIDEIIDNERTKKNGKNNSCGYNISRISKHDGY